MIIENCFQYSTEKEMLKQDEKLSPILWTYQCMLAYTFVCTKKVYASVHMGKPQDAF